ncbi:MAG: hypothetical protein M1839_001151 [Geoglossum umbratile]|nr:MAG: hypothetical protein M1839_001151 [Geoglossum umbratile]
MLPVLPPLRTFSSSLHVLRRAFSTTPRANLARMTVVGRLAADPEPTVTSAGHELVKYAVGTSDGTGENQKTSWYRFGAFVEGPRKDYLLGLKKGTLVYVEGDAKLDNYQGDDGKTHQALRLTQRSISVLSRPQHAQGVAEESS